MSLSCKWCLRIIWSTFARLIARYLAPVRTTRSIRKLSVCTELVARVFHSDRRHAGRSFASAFSLYYIIHTYIGVDLWLDASNIFAVYRVILLFFFLLMYLKSVTKFITYRYNRIPNSTVVTFPKA